MKCWMRTICFAMLVGLFSAGCASHVYVTEPPPEPKQEAKPAAPGPNAVWIPGHWKHQGGRYVWVSGHWDRGAKGRTWVPGHWTQKGRHYIWVEGHWKR